MQAQNFLAPSKQSGIAGKRHINSSAGGEVSLTLNSNYLEDPKTDNVGLFCLKSKLSFFFPLGIQVCGMGSEIVSSASLCCASVLIKT